MSTPAHANRNFFMTLPVQDIAATKEFFTKLGFPFNPKFESESSACMQIGEQAFCMFGTREQFLKFSKLPVADPRTHAMALFCFTVDSREEVDRVFEAAIAAGAVDHDDTDDHGFMYSRSFFDIDGHGWQIMWMDPTAAEQVPEELAAQQEAGASA
jgi:predicted lactoylglutathione lyase